MRRRYMANIPSYLLAVLITLATGSLALAQASITSVSGPPEYVSGGAVRLQVHGAPNAELELVRSIGAGGVRSDLAGLFTRIGPGLYEGVLFGLPAGSTTITAVIGGETARLTLTNHPLTGPMFAGPKQEVFLCATESHRQDRKSTRVKSSHVAIA